jgi:hypothetical protein
MSENKDYYVYAYLDPRKPGVFNYGEFSFNYEPFYIGKGKNKRCNDHIKEAKKIKNLNIKINKANFPLVNLCKISKILKILKTPNYSPIVVKLECNLSEKDSFLSENRYIRTIGRYDLKKGPLTNMTDGGEGFSGNNNIPVIQYNLNGDYMMEFSSIIEASKHIKIDRSAISRASTKDFKTAGGFIWFYKNEFINKIPKKLNHKIVEKLTASKRGKNKKRIVQFSIDGDFIKLFDSIEAAAKYSKCNRGYISKICKDKNKEYCKSSKGFTWFLETDFGELKIPKKLDNKMIKKLLRNQTHNKKIIQLSNSGKIIKKWNSIKEASQKLNISSSRIIEICSKKGNTAGGFTWRYE